MKILLFKLKSVCYNSYLYFTDALANELIKSGHTVDIFGEDDELLDELEKYVGATYDALIDFNSDLPKALCDDDSYFLNNINAPFFDIILDHPLYHHDSLKHKLNNFHVICLDSNHKTYIEKYYPHIKSVTTTFMTGSIAFEQNHIDWDSWENREYKLLFSGSYTAPRRIESAIDTLPDFLQDNIHNIIDILLAHPEKTIESVVEELSENEFYDYIKSDLPLHTQTFYLADAYVRCINRHNFVKSLDKCKYPLHLFGSFWDEIELSNSIIHKELPFNLTFTVFSKAQLSANIMPNFKAGFHDRIFSAQLNGAISLTDTSTSLFNEYTDKKDILYFDLNSFESIPDRVNQILDNPFEAKKIAQEGFEKAFTNHTWANITQSIIESIKNA